MLMLKEVKLNILFIKLNISLNKKEKGKESTRGIRGMKIKGVKEINRGKKNTNYMPLVLKNLSDKNKEVNDDKENKGGKLRRKK